MNQSRRHFLVACREGDLAGAEKAYSELRSRFPKVEVQKTVYGALRKAVNNNGPREIVAFLVDVDGYDSQIMRES